MTKLNILHAGFVATAMLMTPAVAHWQCPDDPDECLPRQLEIVS
jgi:hypothetical protein